MKNVIISLLLVAGLLGSAISAEAASAPKMEQATPGTFEAGKGTFLLNGEPFVVKAAEVHYPRIPRPYWEHRIQMCKALGMNTHLLVIDLGSEQTITALEYLPRAEQNAPGCIKDYRIFIY